MNWTIRSLASNPQLEIYIFTTRWSPYCKFRFASIYVSIIIFRSSSGAKYHNAKHKCDENSYKEFGCPKKERDGSWLTTEEEYIKFSSRLISGRAGVIKDRTIEKYKSSWMSLHPDEEVPLTEDGEPFDFLWDSSHPCTHIPWLKNIPQGDSLTGKLHYFA